MVDSKIGSILNPLLEGLANPYIFAIQANIYDIVDVYVTQKNNNEVLIDPDGKPHVVAGATSVRFKNEAGDPVYIKYVMNGTATILTVNGYEEPVFEETVTLNGNMTVVEVHR